MNLRHVFKHLRCTAVVQRHGVKNVLGAPSEDKQYLQHNSGVSGECGFCIGEKSTCFFDHMQVLNHVVDHTIPCLIQSYALRYEDKSKMTCGIHKVDVSEKYTCGEFQITITEA